MTSWRDYQAVLFSTLCSVFNEEKYCEQCRISISVIDWPKSRISVFHYLNYFKFAILIDRNDLSDVITRWSCTRILANQRIGWLSKQKSILQYLFYYNFFFLNETIRKFVIMFSYTSNINLLWDIVSCFKKWISIWQEVLAFPAILNYLEVRGFWIFKP